MQTKMAQFSKRLTASVICLIMLLSMVTQVAFAWAPPNANGSQGVSNGDTYVAGTFSANLSGYRVSVISRTGEMVKAPQDFLFKDRPVITYGFLKNKWGHSTDGSWKRAPAGMPMPLIDTGSTFKPNGLALKNWLMADGAKVLGKFVQDNFGYTNESLAAVQKDIKIVFEPIFFYRLQTLEIVKENGKKTNYAPIWSPDQRVYGTITEISQFTYDFRDKLGHNWTVTNGKAVKGNPIYGGNTTLITLKAGPNALVTSEDDKELKINKAAPTEKIYPEDVTKVANGIGLHIYGSPDSKPEIPMTYSWDFPIPDPAPAPDPKDIPKLPEEIVDKTRVYNIVKTYRDITADGTIIHVATYSRTKNPATIVIQDEPTYKVNEWFISTKYNNPTSSTTWEQNHNQAPTTGPQGTKPSTTTVVPANNTLYILLEKEEAKLKEGSLIIQESQVTKSVETMTSPVTGWGPKTMTFSADDISGPCGYSWYCGGDYCSGHTCGATYGLYDRSWNYNHINIAGINETIHANVGAFKPTNDRGADATGTRGTVSQYINFVNSFNYKLVVWRGEDVPTIANYKEQSSNTLNTLVKRYGKEPAGQRYGSYSGKSTQYNTDLKIDLAQNMALGDYITDAGHHDESASATHIALNTLNYDTVTTVKVYKQGDNSTDNN